MQAQRISKEMRGCIDECLRCHGGCVEMVVHCLKPGSILAGSSHVRLLLDCAQICATAADFMTRGSPLYQRTCAVCAEVCELCAASCEAMGATASLKDCAVACRACAGSCRRMSGTSAAA